MARIDVPTMECDRCKVTTQDLDEMGKFQTLTGMYDGYSKEKQKWDLCPTCWRDFHAFLRCERIVERVGIVMTVPGTDMPTNVEAGIQHNGYRS